MYAAEGVGVGEGDGFSAPQAQKWELAKSQNTAKNVSKIKIGLYGVLFMLMSPPIVDIA